MGIGRYFRPCLMVVADKVSTADNLKGTLEIHFFVTCSLYGKEEEPINHSFLHCEVSSSPWCRFFQKCGIVLSLLGMLGEMIDAWTPLMVAWMIA